MKKLTVVLAVMIALGAGAYGGYKYFLSPSADMKRMCKLMTQLSKDKKFLSMPPAEKQYALAEAIQGVIYHPDTKTMFEAMAGVSGESKSKLMHSYTNEIMGPGWRCPGIEKMLGPLPRQPEGNE